MIKLVYCISKKPGMTDEEFFDYWERVHGALAARIPHLRRLVQSHRISVAGDKFQTDFDGMAELWFDSVECLEHAMASQEVQAAFAEAGNCFGTARPSMLVVEQIPICRNQTKWI